MRVKKIFFFVTMAFVLLMVNFLLCRNEITLAKGKTMFLKLMPTNPRAPIPKDRVDLRYVLAGRIPKGQLGSDGSVVVTLDADGVAMFKRAHKGEGLSPGEYLLKYKKGRPASFGAETFIFQDGQAKLYSTAEYGELKVNSSGESAFIGLRDKNFKRLGKN